MKVVYRKKDKEYQEWYNTFIEQFNKNLSQYLPNNFDSAKTFKRKIKKIKIKKNRKKTSASYYDYTTRSLSINCSEKQDLHVKIHETMHAMSAVEKRRRFLRDIPKLFFKRYNDFMLEEGLTEYLTNIHEENSKIVTALVSPYSNNAKLAAQLFKTIDPKIILDFYFKNDKRLIKEINKVFPGGYYGLLKVFRECSFTPGRQFLPPVYSKKDTTISTNVMFETFKKVKMVPNDSLENFKKNASLIIYFYREEFYAIKYRILVNKKNLESSSGEQTIFAQKRIEDDNRGFQEKIFDFANRVLRPEWEQLKNSDNHLFESIIIEALKSQIDSNTFETISKQGVFDLINTDEQDTTSSVIIGDSSLTKDTTEIDKLKALRDYAINEAAKELKTDAKEEQSIIL